MDEKIFKKILADHARLITELINQEFASEHEKIERKIKEQHVLMVQYMGDLAKETQENLRVALEKI